MKSKSLWRKRKDVMEFNDKEKESKARSEAALQALHDENMRLGLYDYEIGFIEGKRSREWVGLTDEEFDDCYKDVAWNEIDWCPDHEQLMRAVEKKLKEKNT
jgi:hypothetical protein